MSKDIQLAQRIRGIFRFNKGVNLILYNGFQKEYSFLVGILISRLSLSFDTEYHILCYCFFYCVW